MPKSTYSEKSIKNTIYWLSSEFEMILNDDSTHYLIECLNSKSDFKQKFLQKVNDFSLRDIIENETKEIKSLITAKAFYPDLVDFKDIGEFEDPVTIDERNAEK